MNEQLVIDWAYLAPLEAKVKTSETTAIRARWDFGVYLRDHVPRGTGGRGVVGPLAAISAELGVSETELRYRRLFAVRYPTEEKLVNALTSFGSWFEVIAKGLRGHSDREPMPAPPFPEGTFPTLVADPPWDVMAGPGFETETSRPLEYPTLSVAEIRDFADTAGRPISDLPAPDAHLYLWTINRYVEQTYDIARAWGFKPSTLLVWAKTPHGLGLGGDYVLTTEYVLYCRRGSLPIQQRVDTSWFQWRRGRHSAKPDEFYALVESVSPGPYLDLFGREERAGWVAWGNELIAA